MKKNKAFTLVELIIVLALLSTVTLFFWTILNSSSKDSYTINDKVEVQTSVTSLMNIIQKDIQEAKIFNISPSERGIVYKVDGSNTYKFAGDSIIYTFDKAARKVTRSEASSLGVYDDIAYFSMSPIIKEKYGADIKIIGGKEVLVTDENGDGELEQTADKSRYELNSTYFTRNTK